MAKKISRAIDGKGIRTLVVDIGGSGIKALVLDRAGRPLTVRTGKKRRLSLLRLLFWE